MKYEVIGKQNNTDKCFVCGTRNRAGVVCEFFNCRREDGEMVLVTEVKGQEKHQSYPGRMHGGVISAILDESIGRSVQTKDPDAWAVTIELSVKFRKPVPLGETLYVESFITEVGPRTFSGEGKMMDRGGAVLATAVAKFFRVDYDKLFEKEKLTPRNWYLVKKNLPKEIVIG